MTVPKYKRKALEKIWNILQEIEEKKQITAEFDPIIIPAVPFGIEPNTKEYAKSLEERRAIIVRLKSLGAIMDLNVDDDPSSDWQFFMGDKYKEVFDDYESQYQEAAKDFNKSQYEKEITLRDPAYSVQYSEKSREILVNNFLIAKPDFSGENEYFFTYIYKHPNERVLVKDIQDTLKTSFTKSIHKIIENLGFTGDLKTAFFDVSKTQVRFRNPVTKKDLEELGIKYIKMK